MIAVSAKCFFGGGFGSVSSTVGAKCLRVAFFLKNQSVMFSLSPR